MRAAYRSFAGGEITPELVARADLPQNQTGLALCDNFIVRNNGTLVRRGGLRHICTINRVSESSLALLHPDIVPFTLPNSDQAGVIVGCNMNGWSAPVVRGVLCSEPVLSINVVDVSGVNVTVSGTVATGTLLVPAGVLPTSGVLFVAQTSIPSGPNSILTLGWGSGFSLSEAETARYVPNGTVLNPAFSVPQPALNTPGGGKRYRFSQENDVTTVTIDDPGTSITAFDVSLTSPSPLTFSSAAVAFSLGVNPPTGVTATPTVANGTPLRIDRYHVSSVGPDGTSESLATAGLGIATNNVQIAGNYNTVTWTAPAAGPTPISYRVYFGPADSTIRTYIGQTSGTTFIHDARSIYDEATKPLVSAPPTETFRAVTNHEQRRFFGGSDTRPQTVYGSRINAPSNYSASFPLRADDALVFRLNSTQRSSIQHLVPFIDLLAFTQNSVFRIYSGDNGALRPSSLAAKPQGTVGANATQPVITPNSVLFAQAGGDKLRELRYAYQGNGFATDDAGVFASHLFYKRGIFTLTYAQSPDSIAWLANHGGDNDDLVAYHTSRMLGMTYVPELELRAWHRHTMASSDDFVMAVRSLRVGFEDYLYAIVARKVPGVALYDLNIERMEQSNTSTNAYDGAHLDMHCRFTNGGLSPNLSGLLYLGGRTVSGLLDGEVYDNIVVNLDGTLTLPYAASEILLGLRYSSRIQTLPMWADNAGTMKNANGVRIRTVNSNYINAGPSFDKLTAHQARNTSTNYDTAEPLGNHEARFAIGPSWNADGSVCIEQSLPLPLTVAGMVVEYAQGS
jgi:hypothetical protein